MSGVKCLLEGTRKIYFQDCKNYSGKAREFAVIESMDGGKPIKESKSVDVPLSLAHFFLLCRLG